MSGFDSYIAVTRFGLGARPGDWSAAAAPGDWLRAQLDGLAPMPAALAGMPDSASGARRFFTAQRAGVDKLQAFIRQEYRDLYLREAGVRTLAMIESERPFRDRLVVFWSNHFTVSAKRPVVAGLAGAFEREAIRPHVTGRFADMLLAVARHPAMLGYLDNIASVGPTSPFGLQRGLGLNENLAREILELHTLGVDGGYGQADVVALAKMLTGWNVGRPERSPTPGIFHFYDGVHEPGPKAFLGRHYPEAGEAEGEAALRALAAHPATARHLAAKFARHFVADDPPPALVARLVRRFEETDGDLGVMARALIDSPEAWASAQGKFKTPQDFVVSALRATGFAGGTEALVSSLDQFGQAPFAAPSPRGWSDRSESWAGPEAVLRRAEWALALAHRVRNSTPERVLETALGPAAGADLRRSVAGAASRDEARALVFASPEFQRR